MLERILNTSGRDKPGFSRSYVQSSMKTWRDTFLLTYIIMYESMHISSSVCLSQVSGRSLAHLSQRDALRILAASQRPITMQIKSQRRCGTEADRACWEPLPLNLQHLNLPQQRMGAGLTASSPSFQDRCSHREQHCLSVYPNNSVTSVERFYYDKKKLT